MERVNLIAVSSLKYKGQRYEPGQTFTAARAHARAFKAVGKAKDAGVALETTEASLAPPPTYDTKVLEAEAPSAASELDTPASRTRRSYKRRDINAK